MRWHREQYLDLMSFGAAPRPMFCELFGPLVGLDAEWRAQGASEAEIAMTAFDWDYVPYAFCGGYTQMQGPPPVLIEDNAERRVERDCLGRTLLLLKKVATCPLPMNFPVATMDDWLRVKPFFTFHPDRIGWEEVEAAPKGQSEAMLVVAYILGACELTPALMCDEPACLAY